MTRQCLVVPCESRRPSGARRRYEHAGLSLVASLSIASLGVCDDAGGPTTASPTLLLRSEGAGCPEAALVETQLEPLMPDQRLAIEGPGVRVAEVRDLGSRYEVRVAGDVRVLEDPQRDCLERARAAAVIIALGVRAEDEAGGAAGAATGTPRTASPRTALPQGRPSATAPSVPPESVIGIQLRGTLDSTVGVASGTSPDVALGASLGVALVRAPWRLGVGAGFVGPVTLEGAAGEDERFRILRLPATLTGGHLWDLGGVHLGPGLGAVVETVQLQGVDTPGATGGWRWNVGAVGSLASHWSLGSGWAAVLGLRGTVFPKTYEAWVEPDRSLGSTPRWWLGTFLGLEHVLGRKSGSR